MPKFFLVLLFGMIVLSSCSSLNSSSQKEAKLFYPIWIKNLDVSDYETGNMPISFHSPLIHEGLVFIGDPEGSMHAYNLENGKEVWKALESKEKKLGISNRPSIFGNFVVYGTTEGRLVARDYATGALQYEVDLGESLEAPVTFDKNIAFAHLRNHKLLSLDAVTGKILWTYKRNVASSTSIQEVSQPVVYKGKLFLGFADGVIAAFNTEDGSILWEQHIAEDSKFMDVNMKPVFVDNLMYAGSLAGPLTIINTQSGDILKRFPFRVSRAPMFFDIDGEKRMLVGTTEGEVLLLDASGTNTIAEYKAKVPIYGMSLWDNKILVATRSGKILSLSMKDLKLSEEFHLGSAFSTVFGEFSIDKNKMALFSSRNRLYVFEKK